MIQCQEMSERMPAVAAGRAGWTNEERRHLESCADCTLEFKLVTAALSLGRAAESRIQPAAIAPVVLQRLRAARVSDRWRRRAWIVGLAAAAAVLLVVWDGRDNATVHQDNAWSIPVAELDSLEPTQLQTVLEALEEPLGAGSTIGAPALSDLDEGQLERVLRSLEG